MDEEHKIQKEEEERKQREELEEQARIRAELAAEAANAKQRTMADFPIRQPVRHDLPRQES